MKTTRRKRSTAALIYFRLISRISIETFFIFSNYPWLYKILCNNDNHDDDDDEKK